jgi:hypothetical protein
MSKIWPSLVLVSLKYCTEKLLLKTNVAFFMKVTVDGEKVSFGTVVGNINGFLDGSSPE